MPFRTSDDEVTPGSGGGLLPPGRHLVVVDSVEFEEASDNRKYDRYAITYTKEGQRLTDWLSLTEAAEKRIKTFLRAVGHPYQKIRIPQDVEVTDILGRKLVIEVIQQPNNQGVMRNRISFAGMWMPDEMDEETYDSVVDNQGESI